ncbi:type IV pilus biogenesis protein PilM [Polyangium spumosum]|uniref:General secretion pathway protein GspL n=1 Tax=Polyangium spumosum TaxID=889282 RepID=A0A6N7PU59_9BACT|nr:pilus assembly protein PilM [Polyangium spumosum]MRG93960.1 general secretion pathway protein GspL [Polyangium spumosum]
MSRILGIDVGKAVVRAALLRLSYRKITLEALGEAPVTGLSVDAIRAAVGGHKADAIAIAISGERTFFRSVDMPTSALKEIENVLPFELESMIPFEITEAVFDYRMDKNPGGDTVPIFAAIARTEDVKERIDLVREALGMEPERVGTGALPLANLAGAMPEIEKPFGKEAPAGEAALPVAILDLGEATSDIVILRGGEPVFARTLSRGTLGLPGSAPALSRELRQTLAAWRASGGSQLAGMYLVGGGASAQGAEAFLATELGITILPLPKPRLENVTAEQEAMLPRFAKAIGLAMGLAGKARGLNLRQGDLAAARSYPFLREKIPLLAGLGAAVVVSFVFSLLAQHRSLSAEKDMLLSRLETATGDVFDEETKDPAAARGLLDKGPASADEDPLPRADAFDVMVKLSESVPKEVVHDVLELDLNRGHVRIEGTVPSIPDAQAISEKMKEHKCFKDVKISRTAQFGKPEDGKQKYVLEFELKCDDKKKKTTAKADAADTSSPAAGKEEGK